MLIYGLLLAAFVIALYMTMKSRTVHKFELFILSFFLLTGNYNKLLSLRLPGLSFFEIHVERILYFTCIFFLLRRLLARRPRQPEEQKRLPPAFLLLLYCYVGFLILTQFTHIDKLEITEIVVRSFNNLCAIFIVLAVSLMVDREMLKTVGKVIIIAGVGSAMISMVQLTGDDMFMRVGDTRIAFGRLLRCNGMFSSEYNNAYFLTIAAFWTLITMKGKFLKYALVGLFSAGVFSTFHRMSWVILTLTLGIYFLKIATPAIDRMVLLGLSGLAVVLFVVIFAYRDIMNSSLVQDRLADGAMRRTGYWEMVLDNIGDKPFFGFGNKDNEVYFRGMMEVTRNRDRATGDTGDIHNGYLQSMFFFGIPTFLFFLFYVILSVHYFARLTTYNVFFAIFFLTALLFVIANLTNNFVFPKYLAIVYTIHLGLGYGTRYLDEFLPQARRSLPINDEPDRKIQVLKNENN